MTNKPRVDVTKWLKAIVEPILGTEKLPENFDFATQGADLTISGDGARIKVHLGPASCKMVLTDDGIVSLKLQAVEVEFAPYPETPKETGEVSPDPSKFEPGPE